MYPWIKGIQTKKGEQRIRGRRGENCEDDFVVASQPESRGEEVGGEASSIRKSGQGES